MLSAAFRAKWGRRPPPPLGGGPSPSPTGGDEVDLTEPALEEILAEPAIHLLMRSDNVPMAALRALIAETRARLQPRRLQ